MRTAIKTFSIVGAELIAVTVIVSSRHDSFRSAMLHLDNPVFSIGLTLALAVVGVIAWPLIHKAWPGVHSMRFVACVYSLTLFGTFAAVRYTRFDLIGPVICFLVALLVARMFSRPHSSFQLTN